MRAATFAKHSLMRPQMINGEDKDKAALRSAKQLRERGLEKWLLFEDKFCLNRHMIEHENMEIRYIRVLYC